ncbi:MAG TPA: hypothetical protein VI790_01460 [Candidatus Nanoarchaeia archaeon]|nr:hypothetical protein [Candidatus Nanoarchaeia archaeon]
MNKVIIIISILLLAGCTTGSEGGAPFEQRINSSNALDDGSMLVFKDNTAFGMVSGEGEDLMLGNFKAGNYSVIGRVLYRFNISNWNNTDIIFHLLCTGVYGTPGDIEVYTTSDFGRLPLRPSQPMDVNNTWNLINNGELISLTSAQSGDWFTITIPADSIKSEVLNLILKLGDETITDGNYYVLHSFERGASRNQQKPYLTYN